MPKKKDIIEIYIQKLKFPNKGIGFLEGEKVTVKNVLPGQKVKAVVTKLRIANLKAKQEEKKTAAQNAGGVENAK